MLFRRVQNGILLNFHGVTTRTTHMTGYLTDAGVELGKRLRGVKTERWKLFYFAIHILIYLIGAVVGALTRHALSLYAIAVAGALQIICGPNKIHIVDFEGARVAHFGDLGRDLSQEELEQLKGLDVALIPVGGFFTIDAMQAATIIRAIKPDVTVPMHYFDGVSGWNKTSGVEPFLEQFTCVTTLGTNSFTVGAYRDCVLLLKKP
jgi:hypothetical protein